MKRNEMAQRFFANGDFILGRVGSKKQDTRTQMICLECDHKFKKKITESTYEVRCPKCGGYDTDLA